jgi:hypothetical protein
MLGGSFFGLVGGEVDLMDANFIVKILTITHCQNFAPIFTRLL